MKYTRGGTCLICEYSHTTTAEGWFAEGLANRAYVCKASFHQITKHGGGKETLHLTWLFIKCGGQMVGLIALIYLLWIIWAITWPFWRIHEWMD